MSSTNAPRESLPRLIQDREVIRARQFNSWLNGAHFRGGFCFRSNTRWRPTFFRGMQRSLFLRNSDDIGLVMSVRERLVNYRDIYYPTNCWINLVDYSVDEKRGVVLLLVLLTHHASLSDGGIRVDSSANGWPTFCVDIALAGIDRSNQLWMRHLPVEYCRRGIEACERWLFGMSDGDEMVQEI